MNHFFNGGIDEIRIIDDDLCFHARREGLFILCQLRLDRIDGFNSVGIRRQGDPDAGPFVTVTSGNEIVILGIQFNAGYITQMKHGTIRIGAENDIAEFFRCDQTALDHDRILEGLPLGFRPAAQTAGCHLLVLCLHGGEHFRSGHVVLGHFRRIEPEAHPVFRAELLYIADALDVFQLIKVVHAEIVFQKDIVKGAVRRRETDDQCDICRGLFGGNPQRAHRIR